MVSIHVILTRFNSALLLFSLILIVIVCLYISSESCNITGICLSDSHTSQWYISTCVYINIAMNQLAASCCKVYLSLSSKFYAKVTSEILHLQHSGKVFVRQTVTEDDMVQVSTCNWPWLRYDPVLVSCYHYKKELYNYYILQQFKIILILIFISTAGEYQHCSCQLCIQFTDTRIGQKECTLLWKSCCWWFH